MSHHFAQVLLERKDADVIFLDCTKVFDRLPHDVIVNSLRKHGVDGCLLALFSDYLKGRSQRVMVDGFFSGEREVKSGVPQGSILGPVLFTVAVNGLSGVVSSKVLQYADHIVLYRKVNSEADCLALQKDLDSLTKWCEEVGLDINPKKSQHLRISNKNFKTAIPTGSYNFNGEAIPTEEEAECLGVTFSSRLDWTGQVDKVVAKCRKRLYAIKAFFPRRFGVVKQLLFKSIVRSVMDHASSWHSTGKGLQKKLGNIQKFLQTIRFGCLEGNERHDVDFRQYRQHLAEVGWHPLWQRRLEGILLNAFKIWKGMFAGGQLILKRDMPGRTTRSQAKEFLLAPASFAPASCR
ncbi:hypothetical protein RvY_16614 [Ramazzottius varieornatus]|uniref:Reverse transcriptase domain-containing protein n=1 Tax=Ramazzottius varieornatus TaxID=947166 RepID=A0A1D1VZ39_RAMVA|nr:hypothetical protein RvY_16614 [Ramazzottius varieornatus]